MHLCSPLQSPWRSMKEAHWCNITIGPGKKIDKYVQHWFWIAWFWTVHEKKNCVFFSCFCQTHETHWVVIFSQALNERLSHRVKIWELCVGRIYCTNNTSAFRTMSHWCKLLNAIETFLHYYTAIVKAKSEGKDLSMVH